LDYYEILYLSVGSIFGLTSRVIVQKNYQPQLRFLVDKTSLVNFLASFCLGIFVAMNITNKNLVLLFYLGFLGSFSTFSSFIYQIFILFRRKQFMQLIFYYVEIIVKAFVFFYLGYLLVKIF